jgi:hypothetical protein
MQLPVTLSSSSPAFGALPKQSSSQQLEKAAPSLSVACGGIHPTDQNHMGTTKPTDEAGSTRSFTRHARPCATIRSSKEGQISHHPTLHEHDSDAGMWMQPGRDAMNPAFHTRRRHVHVGMWGTAAKKEEEALRWASVRDIAFGCPAFLFCKLSPPNRPQLEGG